MGNVAMPAMGLIALMIPTSMGMIIANYRPQYIPCIHKWIKRVSWAAMIVISLFAIYANYYIFWLITWPIVLCGCALPWLGYLTAFVVASTLRQQFKDALTIAIETGIQNIGIAMLLMVWCLPEPESDIAVTIIFVTAIMTDKPLTYWNVFSHHCKQDLRPILNKYKIETNAGDDDDCSCEEFGWLLQCPDVFDAKQSISNGLQERQLQRHRLRRT
ncbi:hypothetical protein TELCIR_05850 [Teladorsagia circumcincta]|uniref:Sodium bile acid symporter family protein n=1 Tax=Teladorsagia circumcincta TaxID=45464 RepID=A0A2G9UPN2_TELCI|nr:hypothetical protein TELCIR_05850 [Teladorsagia circumcincta]